MHILLLIVLAALAFWLVVLPLLCLAGAASDASQRDGWGRLPSHPNYKNYERKVRTSEELRAMNNCYHDGGR